MFPSHLPAEFTRLRIPEILPHIYILGSNAPGDKTRTRDRDRLIVGEDYIARVEPDSALVGVPEAHLWWSSRASWDVTRSGLLERMPRPVVLSIPDTLCHRTSMGVSIPELEEVLLYREPPDDRRRRAPGHRPPLVAGKDDAGIIASGGYETGALSHARETDSIPMVSVDERGIWVSRCHLTRRPLGLIEIAGVETTPGKRGEGNAKSLLFFAMEYSRDTASGFIYLSGRDNEASLALAASLGFHRITVFKKHLIT